MFAQVRAPFLFLFLFMSAVTFAAAAPTAVERQIKDVPYSKPDNVPLLLDGCLPVSAQPTPAVVIVHGGGWVAGDRRYNVEPLFQPLTKAGFAWFSISYRLATNVANFGVAIDDVQAAVRFVKEHAAEYNIDPDRIALIGESAGGQLAAMAALRPGKDSSVEAVVALYTPSDLVSLAKTSSYVPASIRNQIKGSPWEPLILAGLAQLSPVNNLHAGMPPFLLIHGTSDSLVPFSQSVDMCDRIRHNGGTCEVIPMQGAGHGIRWWESDPALAARYKRDMIQWLKVHLVSKDARS